MSETVKHGSSVEFGAKQAVVNCLKVQSGEKVVIISDEKTKFIADKLFANCEKITPGNTELFLMECYGDRPEDGSDPLKFPDIMGDALKEANVSFYCADARKGELKSFRTPMLECVEANKKLRHGHMPKVDKLLMETGMSVDYEEVQKLSKKIYDIVNGSRTVTVTTPTGTNFTAELNPSWKWIICDALIQPDNWNNLPDGEVFTCAKNVEKGTIVVDGVLGDFFCAKYGIMEKYPMTIEVENSRIVDVRCDNKELLEDFNEYIRQDENANRLSELAIGTNIGLESLVGNLLQDEKFPGVHVAFGHGYPEKTGSDWNSDAHVDAVLVDTTVLVDGKKIMEDGKFLV